MYQLSTCWLALLVLLVLLVTRESVDGGDPLLVEGPDPEQVLTPGHLLAPGDQCVHQHQQRRPGEGPQQQEAGEQQGQQAGPRAAEQELQTEAHQLLLLCSWAPVLRYRQKKN